MSKVKEELEKYPKSKNFKEHREDYLKQNSYTIHTPISKNGTEIDKIIITGYKIDTNEEFNSVTHLSEYYKWRFKLDYKGFCERFKK